MAVEAKRGCGYRKVGGLYMVGGKLSAPCCKLPIPLHICPTCGNGIKQTRGFTWIDPRPFLTGPCKMLNEYCAAESADGSGLGEIAGLLWIGTQFYPTAEHFRQEAATLGVCRRLTAIPRNFKLGETWILLAHPKAITVENEHRAAIFSMFKPTAIEKIVTETEFKNAEAMDDLRKRGITPVPVPDDDPDHRGSVYDKDDEDEAAELPIGKARSASAPAVDA